MEKKSKKISKCESINAPSLATIDGHIVVIEDNIEKLKENCRRLEEKKELDHYFKTHPIKIKPDTPGKTHIKTRTAWIGTRG